MKFISFQNESHFGIMSKVPWGRTIRFLMRGGGIFCLLPIARCVFFQYNFYVIKEFGYVHFTRVVCFFLILPSEFQVIISGSKEQQQKDSYQSEVPFSVTPSRTP